MPVDASVISADEYLASLSWLEQQLQLGADSIQTQISQVVLIHLPVRTQTRRSLWAAALRPSRPGRHLSSRPSLPRPPAQDTELDSHAPDRCADVSARARTLQGGLPDATSLALRTSARSGRKCVCLPTPDHRRPRPRLTERFDGSCRQSTPRQAEHRLVFHHLRHSAATWLWLKLRAPDHPQISELSSSMPALRRELLQARRLRVQLCGAAEGPSRSYSNVVSRILGHGMPGTSLEHYIHVSDLFLAATTQRTASSTPVTVWQALTGASRSTVYEWLEHGPTVSCKGIALVWSAPTKSLRQAPKKVRRHRHLGARGQLHRFALVATTRWARSVGCSSSTTESAR